MIKQVSIIAAIVLMTVIAAKSIFAGDVDPGKPDTLMTESVNVKAGQSAVVGIKLTADDVMSYNAKDWKGVGSFCIPLKYDRSAFKVDSIKFTGTFAKWDEKFTNSKIDTGFVSFAGIFNIGGGDNPVFFSPTEPEEVIRMFISVDKKAKPGSYTFALTTDPIQKEPYLGSPNGMHGWKPTFISGKIEVE